MLACAGLFVARARTLLTSTSGYDYVLTGDSWPNPSHITYSIAPDGVSWDNGVNVLNATFNAKFGTTGAWQYQIAKALATWESVANINIAPVGDGPYAFNTPGLVQGDPRFGDIRFGGYPFPNSSTTLAQTYFPPPDGSTGAGDVEINTAMDFGINAGYDLYSVLLHETGHSLGLNHPQNPVEVMYPVYQGIRTGLAPGDIAGIQAIYGARPLDGYQAQGLGYSEAVPIDISSGLTRATQTSVSNVWLTYIGSAQYYGFVAPPSADGSVQVTVSAANISMLSPEVSIYDATGKLLGQAANPSAWSDEVTAVAPGISAGERYYIRVSGATTDVFGVGAYAMSVTLLHSSAGNGSPAQQSTPPATFQGPPSTGIPPDRFEPNNTPAAATWLGRINQDTVSGVNISSASDLDYFKFQTASSGSYQVTAQGMLVQVFTARGRLIAGAANHLSLPAARRGTIYLVRIQPPTAAAVPAYDLSITHPITRAASHASPALVGWRRSRGWASTAPASHTSLPDPSGFRPHPAAARIARPELSAPPDAAGEWSLLTACDRGI